MDLYEYQARELFAAHDVPVLKAVVASDVDEAAEAFMTLASPLVVVKGQVKTGGRGKAGGVQLAHSAEETAARARDILGMNINGHIVRKLLIAEGADIVSEFYFSIVFDRSRRQHLAICSPNGGINIETAVRERPDTVALIPLKPGQGITGAVAAQIVKKAGFSPDLGKKIAPVLEKLWDVYEGEDATLVEVNPLVVDGQGNILALDGKMTLDDNAAFRHPDHRAYLDCHAVDPRETLAKKQGLKYVHLTGQVGIIGNGAGLVMSTLDLVAFAGEKLGVTPANFLDIGGGASASIMAKALKIIVEDSQVCSVFVNIFGGITACDEVAVGILQAFEQLGEHAQKPLVVRLDGNKFEEGRAILTHSGNPLIHMAETMDEAATMAAELARA